MQKSCILYYILFSAVLFFSCSKNQTNDTDELVQQYVKINKLILLADSFFVMENNEAADSVLQDALQLAEATRNQDIILRTLFYNTALNINANSTKERLDNYKVFINQGLEYATLYKRQDFIAYANANLAELYIAKGDLANALKAGNMAFSIAFSLKNDSCKIVTALQLGKVYENQKELVLAYKTYSNANDIANATTEKQLLPEVYHHIGGLYETLNKNEEAKEYYFKSLDLNKNNIEGQIKDFIALGSIYDYKVALVYLQKAIDLSNKTNNLRFKKKALMYLFSYKIINGNPKDALAFFNQHPLVGQVYANRGPKYLNWIIGEVYLYGNELDSAKYYFDKCISEFKDDYDKNAKINVLAENASIYQQLNMRQNAIEFYKETNDLSLQTANISNVISSAQHLKTLYEETGNYKEALFYANIQDKFKDTLGVMMKEREFATLEIENENKKRALDLKFEEQRIQKVHTLQYIGILISITLFFMGFIFLSGKNKFSSRAIEVIGFFAFIFLFEFITLILDSKIHHVTHGSPLKIWLIKIVIISFLLPLHHFIEEEAIHYLTSKKLIKTKERFNWKLLWSWIPWLNNKHIPQKPKPRKTIKQNKKTE